MPPMDEKGCADRRRRDQATGGPTSGDPRWNTKQGTPKDRKMTKLVERSSGRYSASEQSEKKASVRRQTPVTKTR